MKTIDLNSDLGEGFGPYRIAEDEALLEIVTSANIACGFHAGDPDVMDKAVRKAISNNVAIGAHIGYDDRKNFGRRPVNMSLKELSNMVAYQLGALQAITSVAGGQLTHANFHGALGNLSFVDEAVAKALILAVKSVDSSLKFVGLPHTQAAHAAEDAGLDVVYSFLADRAYHRDGTLVSRQEANSVIHDHCSIEDRVASVVNEGRVMAYDGTVIDMPARSILIHSDTAGALELAKLIKDTVIKSGATIAKY